MRRAAAVLGAVLLTGATLIGRQAYAQQGTIRIASPANGSTVNGPVTLQVQIGGVTVKPAAEGDPQAFHYHALVDVDPATVLQPGQPLPTGQANIIHTADLSLPLANLQPGPHTVTAVLTRTDHVPLAPSVQDRVTFTVAAAQAGAAGGGQSAQPAAPRVGAGLAADAPSARTATAALAALLAIGGGGMLAVRRRARR